MKKIAFAALVLLALCAGGSFATELIYLDQTWPPKGLEERVTKLELEMQRVVAWIYRVPEPIECERNR